MAEVLLAALASAALGSAPTSAAGLAPPSSSSASSSAVASAPGAAATSFAPMEQVPQQGTVADLVAGFVTPEAAASTAPPAGSANRSGPAVLLLSLSCGGTAWLRIFCPAFASLANWRACA